MKKRTLAELRLDTMSMSRFIAVLQELEKMWPEIEDLSLSAHLSISTQEADDDEDTPPQE